MRQSPVSHSASDPGSHLAISSLSHGTNAVQEPGQHNELERKRQKKQRRLEKQRGTTLTSDDVKDYKGNQDLNDLVLFIEGNKKDCSDAGAKTRKKKQEKSNKIELLNGSLSSEGKKYEDVNVKDVASMNKVNLEVMGNSSGRDTTDEMSSVEDSINMSTASDENLKNHINSLSSMSQEVNGKDFVCPKPAGNKKQNDLTNNKLILDGVKSVQISNGPKKQTKNKGVDKKERSDSSSDNGPVSPKSKVPAVNGPLSPTLSMVKSRELIEPQGTLPRSPATENKNMTNDEALGNRLELKKEESFTEVKKKMKKKRAGIKENGLPISNFSANNFQPYNFSSASYQSRNTGSGYRNNMARPRASTPPPMSVSSFNTSSLCSGDKENPLSRDLSPSSFPVLAGHGPSGLRADGRRNSCGDITSDIMDNKSLYDSDRESVKSLPVAHAVKPSAEAYAAYPVSYARMAAAPKRGLECVTSPSSESGVVSGSHNSSVSSSLAHTPGSSIDINSPQSPNNPVVTTPERKTTVWKGSPRERRHSIGSSPEDTAENEKSNISHRNRQKSGSQEFLSKEAPTVLSTAPVKNIQVSEVSDVSIEVSSSENVLDTLQSEENKPHAPSVAKCIEQPVNVTSVSLSPCEYVASTVAVVPSAQSSVEVSNSSSEKTSVVLPKEKSEVICNTLHGTNLSGQFKALEENNIVSKPSPASTDYSGKPGLVITSVSGEKATAIPGAETSKKSMTGSSSSSSSSKSVIFLDKRFDSAPRQNLGITFGFDSTFDSVPQTLSDASSQAAFSVQQQQQVRPQPSSEQLTPVTSSLLPSSSQLSSAKQTGPKKPPASSHIPAPSTVSSSVPHSQSATSSAPSSPSAHVPPSQHSNNSNKVPKGPHIQGPYNGLIVPSTPVRDSSTKQTSTLNSNSVTRTGPASSSRNTNSGPEISSAPGCLATDLGNAANFPPLTTASVPLVPLPTVAASPLTTTVGGVVFSPNHPPPPLPVQMSQSAVPLPPSSILKVADVSLGQDGLSRTSSKGSISSVSPSDSSSNLVSNTEDTPETTVEVNTCTSSTTAKNKSPASSGPLRIVYGLKIKPSEGCGVLMFMPPSHIDRKGRINYELSGFLKKKWCDIREPPHKNSPSFISLAED